MHSLGLRRATSRERRPTVEKVQPGLTYDCIHISISIALSPCIATRDKGTVLVDGEKHLAGGGGLLDIEDARSS